MQHAGTKTIKTQRLTLRKIELTDAGMMFRNWANDDEVTRYMRWAAHKDVEETKATIQNWFDGYKESNKYYCTKSYAIKTCIYNWNASESSAWALVIAL